MNKKKTELDFIHSFIPPKYEKIGDDIDTRTSKQETEREGKTFTTFLLLHGTGGNLAMEEILKAREWLVHSASSFTK